MTNLYEEEDRKEKERQKEKRKLVEGIWFKSKTTGELFAHDKITTSDIDCVLIDGAWFDRSEWN